MKIGFIGAGNMAQAIFRGMLKAGVAAPNEIYVSDVLPELCDALSKELGVQAAPDNPSLVCSVDMVVLAVKPVFAAHAIAGITGDIGAKPMISIVGSFTFPHLVELFPEGAHLLRVMPNTPAMVGEGNTLLCQPHTLTEAEYGFAVRMFEAVGTTVALEERLFDAATALSGCGPAFLYIVQEAMADAGVSLGLPRAMAYQLCAQTMLGAGKTLRDSGKIPGALKDAVCSPGGTTIPGVLAMEEAGGRNAMIQAVLASYRAMKEQAE